MVRGASVGLPNCGERASLVAQMAWFALRAATTSRCYWTNARFSSAVRYLVSDELIGPYPTIRTGAASL